VLQDEVQYYRGRHATAGETVVAKVAPFAMEFD
jgi:hypothetical protein